jgi:hypothetical protein
MQNYKFTVVLYLYENCTLAPKKDKIVEGNV